ncbi:hypothetical protein, partial [Serratia marcescens]
LRPLQLPFIVVTEKLRVFTAIHPAHHVKILDKKYQSGLSNQHYTGGALLLRFCYTDCITALG